MRRYLVENVSDEMQTFFGHALGRVRGGRKGGSIWLSEEEFQTYQVQARISYGSLVLVKTKPPIPVEVPVVEEEAPVSTSETVIEPEVIPEVVEQVEEAEEIVEEVSEAEEIDYNSWKPSKLRSYLKELGIYDSSLRKKADMVKAIEEHHNEN